MNPLPDEELERLARKRANSKMGWYTHAAVYVLVNLLIFARSEYGFGYRTWSTGPLFWWGFGLAMHGLSVFVLGTGSGFRERMVQKERERLLRERQDREP